MTTTLDVAAIATLAAIWLTAGVLADALPEVRTARALLRRARALSILVGVGATGLVAAPVIAGLAGGRSGAPVAVLLPAVPGLVVLIVTWRRLGWLRRGAAAFSAAPLTPAPPALRAAAAHPLLATPLQVTGLTAIAGVPIAAGLVHVPGAAVAGMAVTAVALGAVAIAVRHAIRHSRLAEHAVRIRAAFLG